MARPQISVTALSNGWEADGSPVVFSFSRTGPTDAALSVGYQLFGSAKAGSDYSGSGTGAISFAVGSTTASLTLPALADGALIDPGETIIARINPTELYTISPGKQFATATITAEGIVVTPKVSSRAGWNGNGGEALNLYAFAALKSDGTVVAWGSGTKGGTTPTGLSGVSQIFSNTNAFAALKSDGSVVAWGDSQYGGTAPTGLSGVTQVFSNSNAFAALKGDGTVVAWGDPNWGGTAPTGLGGVTQIVSTVRSFAALKSNGTVVAWGDSNWGGTAPTGLGGVTQIVSAGSAFAALKSDGTVVAWGNGSNGGTAPTGLGAVTQIVSTGSAFAALKSDGTVVAWGSSSNSSTAPTGLGDVTQIFSNDEAFVALKSDGTVVAWGNGSNGGTATTGLGGVTQIVSTEGAFAALKSDGTVVAWGDSTRGGTAPAGLGSVTQIFSTGSAFAALKSDGTVVAWGNANWGGAAPAGLGSVTQIFSNYFAFTALKSDGTVVAWGDSFYGGTAPVGLGGVVGFANPFTDDRFTIAPNKTGAPYTPITSEAAGLIKLSSDSQGIYNVQSTLPSQLSKDSVNTPKEQLGSGLLRQKYRNLSYGFEAQPGDVLSVLYTGRLVDGTIFDTNTTAGKPEFSFTLGAGQVIQGFDLGLTGASLGDIYHLEIPASLGYGARATGSIPANSTLLFDVEIRGISRGSSRLTYQNAIGNTVDTFTLKKDGNPIHTGTLGSEWMIIAAERVNEVNQVLWKNRLTNKLLLWTFDSNWNWTSSGALVEPSSGKGKEVESQFGVDINGDGSIYVYKTGTTSASVDVMMGSSADEFFAPLGVGATGLDRIILGGGKNQIQLQAPSGTNLYANNKESDLLVVEDFNVLTDQLLLAASQTYGSLPANLGTDAGLAIYEDKNKDKSYNNDDEILVWLKGVTTMPAISFGAATFSALGTTQVGKVLTIAQTADDPDGNGTFSYQWQSSTDGTTWNNIGANAATYTLTANEQSKQVRVRVAYTDAQNFSESLTIAAGTVAAVNDGPAPINDTSTTPPPIIKDLSGKEASGVTAARKTSSLSALTASVPLKAESRKLLDRYKINDSTSAAPKKASDIDSSFIDFTIKTGALKSITAEVALDKEVKANAYVKVNPNTGEAFDFTYDPITGLGAELLDTNKNGLVDTLKIHLQDGAKGDVDGLINGEIRDPGVLADAPRQSVYRFFKASKGVHLYSASEEERAIVNANPEWGYKDEGVAYDALVTQGKALHRFFNAKASYHFMTTNDEEAKTVKANPAWGFSYEGESFSVSTISQLGMSTPVNRFYRVLDGVGQHFYTASADEANNIIAHPEWGYKSEGVGWYV